MSANALLGVATMTTKGLDVALLESNGLAPFNASSLYSRLSSYMTHNASEGVACDVHNLDAELMMKHCQVHQITDGGRRVHVDWMVRTYVVDRADSFIPMHDDAPMSANAYSTPEKGRCADYGAVFWGLPAGYSRMETRR